MQKLLRSLWCAAFLSGCLITLAQDKLTSYKGLDPESPRCLITLAQDKPVTGVVKDPKDNSPLPGATIINKRTKKAVQTNNNGEYTIQARPGDVLAITHVGRKDQKLTVGTTGSYTTLLQPAEGDMGDLRGQSRNLPALSFFFFDKSLVQCVYYPGSLIDAGSSHMNYVAVF